MSEPWLDALRAEAEAHGQAAAGRRLGYAASVVSQVLKGSYKGDLNAVRRAVEGALLGATVACPVLGPLATQHCVAMQRRARPQAPEVLRVWRACRAGCPNFKGQAAEDPNREEDAA